MNKLQFCIRLSLNVMIVVVVNDRKFDKETQFNQTITILRYYYGKKHSL